MTVQSLSSGYIQKNFGTVLDSVLTGTAAIVERYSRPLAVIISHGEYERFKALERKMIDAKFEALNNIEPITFDELDKILDAPTD